MFSYDSSYYGCRNRTRTFADIFPDVDTFKTEFGNSALKPTGFSDDSQSKLYYLLYAAYGNSHIASSDETQFKYKLYTIVFSKGIQWQKAVEIQDKLQTLTDKDILARGQNISSHAYNPGEGGTTTVEGSETPILNYVNDQSSTTATLDKVSAYSRYLSALTDVTTDFIASFAPLFLKVVYPDGPLLYVEGGDDDGN